ncbi:hypothetical protein ABZP36_034611 [Zizania latifolia]
MTDFMNESAIKPGRKSRDNSSMAFSVATSGSMMKSEAKVDTDTVLRTQFRINFQRWERAPESFSQKKGADEAKAPSMEPPRTSLSKRQSHAPCAKSQSKPSPSPAASCTWSKAEGMNETVELATTLGKQSSHITMVLSQLKKISDWLDGVGKIAEETATTKDKIEPLKPKIYGFVISHVGFAFESNVAVSSRSRVMLQVSFDERGQHKSQGFTVSAAWVQSTEGELKACPSDWRPVVGTVGITTWKVQPAAKKPN